MVRKYSHIKQYEKTIFAMKSVGKTNREIGNMFGLNKKQIENLVTRHNHKEQNLQTMQQPKHQGRPRKSPITSEHQLELENKRLRMENELLRDFLYLVKRK